MVSLRSAKNRLYGNYTLTKYTINGVDSLQQMLNRYGLHFEFRYVETNDDDALQIDGGNSIEIFACRYGFINHKKSIRLYNHGSFLFTGWGTPNPQDVDIDLLKLMDHDVHMETIYNGKDYYFELTGN